MPFWKKIVYPDVPLWLSVVFIVGGLFLLTWSADRFVDGSSAVARALGVSPFIIGMVVIGFGTSAPELAVSAMSGCMGHSNLSLGNAYGSNIFNIAVVLGVAALIRPLTVRPAIVTFAVPLLLGVSVLSGALTCLGSGFSRLDGLIELVVFAVLLPLYCWHDRKDKSGGEGQAEQGNPIRHPGLVIVMSLAVLVGSSHLLVWGAVDVARELGVSELLIGLTVVAAGTSLPELASAIVSARKGQHEFVLGNIVGSNFFNTLAVVGLSGTIAPFKDVSPYVLARDLPVMLGLTLAIGVFGFRLRRSDANGRINRIEATCLLLSFAAYTVILLVQEA